MDVARLALECEELGEGVVDNLGTLSMEVALVASLAAFPGLRLVVGFGGLGGSGHGTSVVLGCRMREQVRRGTGSVRGNLAAHLQHNIAQTVGCPHVLARLWKSG